MEMIKKKVSKFVDKSAEIIRQKGKKIEKYERVFRILWDNTKRYNINVTGVSGEERVWCWKIGRKQSWNFWNLVHISLQIQVSANIGQNKLKEIYALTHIIKLLNTEDKDKNPESRPIIMTYYLEKQWLIWQLTFHQKSWRAERRTTFFKSWKKRIVIRWILHSVKIFLTNEGEITFSNEEK